MAFSDTLKSFLEDRLLAFDSTIDLSENSPAQTQIISPVIDKFGEDPFSTDISTFITDRLVQEFPDLAADNAGMIEDILNKPLQLLLEPLKREIELVRIGASVANASIMAEEEADALGANWFVDRNAGGYASGTVRLYYSQPVTSRVSTDKRLSTNDGRSFFPIQNYFITASAMLFNKQGSFYFLDIVVRAESPGDNFNVDRNEITSIQDVPGIAKVANLNPFTTGAPKETNTEYLDRIQQSLTDRSLVTKRGILARTDSLFDNVRAIQVVGAGDDGMNRDILTGTGEGFLHMAGKAVIYGNWLWTEEITYKDDGADDSITPQPGDLIRVHETSPAPVATTVFEATIKSILSTSASPPLYLFELEDALFAGVTTTGAFALLKPGNITISNIPGGMAPASITVPDNQVHLGGHTDVFVRPTEDVELQTVLQNISDDRPSLPILDLVVPTAGSNEVTSANSDFLASGVTDKDLLVIDTGAGFAGTYKILEVVDANTLRLDDIFSIVSPSSLRARIITNIHIDLVNPKLPKLPFDNSPVSDLQTNVGSSEFLFASINIQEYGAKEGDTIRIMDGTDAGEFTIVNFGPVAGSVFVNKSASATGSNLSYQVYTKQNGIELPLIRVKTLEILDSTGQVTGITVPYGDAVDVRPEFDFDTAGKDKTTYDKQLVIFPDMREWASGGLAPDAVSLGSIDQHVDARYTQGLSVADGVVRKITHNIGNQIRTTEINVPPFLWNGKNDKVLALVSRTDETYPSTIPGVHKSSDLADAKVGDSLVINDGPNQGKYVIIDHRVLDLWGKTDIGHRKVAVIQVDPPFRVDPIRTGLDLINDIEGTTFFNAATLFGFLQYAADWDDPIGFYATFIERLNIELGTLGITMTNDELKAFFDPMVKSSYTVGPSATGNFRLNFVEPVSAEFYFDDAPTTFSLTTDSSKVFRLDPNLSPSQLLPESLVGTSPGLWNRNLGVRMPQDTYAYLTSGSSFSARGIRAGDTLEVYPAINDIVSRGQMTSSWMCITESNSNIVRLIMPQSNTGFEDGYGGADNFANLSPGQLLFIDSGPDAGAYVITRVVNEDWVSNPPSLIVQIDQTLTHTTESMPVLSTSTVPPSQVDFDGVLPAYVMGTDITFPVNLNGKHLKIDISTNGGTSYSSVEHTFTTSDPYNDMATVVSDINADGAFTAVAMASSSGNKLILISVSTGPRVRLRINAAPTAPSALTTLLLTGGAIGAGVRGAATLPDTKRIYGSTLNECQVNDWITIYAAYNSSILSAGSDEAILGTFKITAVGTDTAAAPFWDPINNFVELDRSANFPTGSYVNVRWIRHKAPDIEPSNTSGGGKDISDQYVRVRLYAAAPKELTIANIPWVAASIHPLLATSTQQIQLESPGVVDTGSGQRNYSHMSPYRVVRPGVYRISSTEMSSQRDGALYYVDIPVVGYGPGKEMNVTTEESFVLTGRRNIDGFTLLVEDENFVYSQKEQVHIILPTSVLPVGATSELDNKFSLAGQNIQITYNNAPVVEDLQAFFDSPLDRVTAANMLVRHFLPGYVILDADYTGGADEDSVATEIISYINNIDPDIAEIRTDIIQDIIKRKGASTVTLPLTLISLFHGTDRRVRGMRSKTSIGIGNTPFFKGNFQQTYFIAGPNTSKAITRPNGEQIFLKRS